MASLLPRASAVRRAAAATEAEHDALLIVRPAVVNPEEATPAALPALQPPLHRFRDLVNSYTATYMQQRVGGVATVEDVWVMLFHSPPSRRSQLSTFERWAIAKHCAGVTHIELAFRRSDGCLMAFTVDRHNPTRDPASGRVRAVWPDPQRAYPPYADGEVRLWTHHHISSLSPAERLGLLEFCHRQVGKPMNAWGMYLNFMPFVGSMLIGASREEEDTYYCSQLVASALRWIRPEQFAAVDARRCTPHQLVCLLAAHHDMFLTSSFRPVSAIDLGAGDLV